jgi:hypothetical protein
LRYFTDVKSFVKDNNYYFITEVISHEPIHSSVFSLDCYCENYTDLGSTASWGKLTQNDINDIILSATELNQVDLVETVKSVISNKLRSWNSNLIDSLSQVNNQSSTEEILNEIELWEKKSQNYSYVSKVVEIVSTYLDFEYCEVQFEDGNSSKLFKYDNIEIEDRFRSFLIENEPYHESSETLIHLRIKVTYDPKDNNLIEFEKVNHSPYLIELQSANSIDHAKKLIGYSSIKSDLETTIDGEKVYGFLQKFNDNGQIIFIKPSSPSYPFFRYEDKYDLLAKLWNDFPETKKVELPQSYFQKITPIKEAKTARDLFMETLHVDVETTDGIYSYKDNSAELVITISGNSWRGKTMMVTGFGSDYDNQNAQYNNGIVKGNDLYESSGMVKVGYVNGSSLTTLIGSQSVTLRK